MRMHYQSIPTSNIVRESGQRNTNSATLTLTLTLTLTRTRTLTLTLDLLMLQAREAHERGWLESDRSSSSWKEFRRRQRQMRERIEEATGRSADGMGINVMDL